MYCPQESAEIDLDIIPTVMYRDPLTRTLSILSFPHEPGDRASHALQGSEVDVSHDE